MSDDIGPREARGQGGHRAGGGETRGPGSMGYIYNMLTIVDAYSAGQMRRDAYNKSLCK